ncbi:MAG: rfaE bifunctional protein kinase chain/domain [Chlamydiales bacterium]
MTIPDFNGLPVAVIGDLIADHYIFAQPQRLSREAPVMVLSHQRDELGAGGAANVARNLAALGARVALFGVVGRDANGREVLRILEEQGIDTAGVELVPEWSTPTKTRILAAEPRRSLQQVLRIDREPETAMALDVIEGIAGRVAARSGELEAVLLSDYEYGALGAPLIPVVARMLERGKVVVLDPRRNFELFPGITALTPNLGELAQFLQRRPESLDDPADLRDAAREVLVRCGARWLLVTRGNQGMAIFGEGLATDGVFIAASGAGDVTDVCGAGDTAAAVFGLGLAAGMGAASAMELANVASGVVVMEHGAAFCSAEQLHQAVGAAPAPDTSRGLRK